MIRIMTINKESGITGADPGILESGGPVRVKPELSTEGASAGEGSGGLPQKILKN